MASFFPTLKDGFTLIKEKNGIIDFGLTKDELEILPSTHATKGWKIDQKNLIVKKSLHNKYL